MKCGAKCFLVEMEVNGRVEVRPVNAKSPIEARKTIRLEFGKETKVLSVTSVKKNSSSNSLQL